MIPPRKPTPVDETVIAELRTAIRHKIQHAREHRYLYRLLCVLLLAEGHSPQQVAEWLGEHARTLERWRKRFLEQGLSGLRDDTSPGRPPKLTVEQMAGVLVDLNQPPYMFGFTSAKWQGKVLKEHLREKYRVDISLRQCQRLLRQFKDRNLGIVPTVPEPLGLPVMVHPGTTAIEKEEETV